MRRGTFIALLALLLVQPVAAAILLTQKPQWASLSSLAFIGSWAFLVFRFVYKYWDRFYFFVESMRLRWTGAGATWQAQAEYAVEDIDSQLIRSVVSALRKGDDRSVILAEEPLRVVMRANQLTLSIRGIAAAPDMTTGDGLGSPMLAVQVVESTWPFRKAIDLTTDTVPAIFETVRGLVSPQSEKYWTEIRFTDGNPYFGFFLRNLQLATVDQFIVELRVAVIGDPQPAAVTARKDKMTVVTRKSSTLATVSRRYLSMARS